MSASPLTYEQTIQILTGPREIPGNVTHSVETMLSERIPIVDADRFSDFIVGLMVEPPAGIQPNQGNFYSIVALGSCSTQMAWQQAGDIQIPRPRRLHEHNQSVLTIYDTVFRTHCTDPRDRLLKPMFSLQDGGKAHCVALADPSDPRKNRNQLTHNLRVAKNVLSVVPSDVLSNDEKTVIQLLIRQTAIGKALRRHQEKNQPLDDVIAEARIELDDLRARCPDDYRDRFDEHLLVSFLADAGAHTQRAYFKDATSGEIVPDVMPRDRYNADGSETNMTLDRIFSEAPADRGKLRLFRPKHMAVMKRLFPKHY